jgi:hypothetical protein
MVWEITACGREVSGSFYQALNLFLVCSDLLRLFVSFHLTREIFLIVMIQKNAIDIVIVTVIFSDVIDPPDRGFENG